MTTQVTNFLDLEVTGVVRGGAREQVVAHVLDRIPRFIERQEGADECGAKTPSDGEDNPKSEVRLGEDTSGKGKAWPEDEEDCKSWWKEKLVVKGHRAVIKFILVRKNSRKQSKTIKMHRLLTESKPPANVKHDLKRLVHGLGRVGAFSIHDV